MDEEQAKKIKALQDWYKEEYHGFELSTEDARELLIIAEDWGINLLRAAYDIEVDGYTRECDHYVDIEQYEIQVVKKEIKSQF